MLNDKPAVGVDDIDSSESEVEELDRIFEEGLSCDKGHFANQRTAILLYKGEHHRKKVHTFLDRVKDNVTPDTKLKLSENHTQVVCNRLISSITNTAPGALFVPNNDNELADVKDADLCNSVKEFAENDLNYENLVQRLATNFVVTGEMFQFFYFDPFDGDVIGYEQKVDAGGLPLYNHPTQGEVNDSHIQVPDPTQPGGIKMQPLEMVQDKKKPVFRGKLKLKVWHPYNVIRHKSSDNIEESPVLCLQEMITQHDALKLIKSLPKDEYEAFKQEIKSTADTTFKIFDSTMGDYTDSKGQVVLKYWFFRKCYRYPNGCFKLQLGKKILSSDELPYGIWPIEYTGFRTVPGSARATSIINDIRPAQTHLNFLISNSAFHMIALGDDKIVTQMNSNVQMGPTWNGVRTYKVNGPSAQVIPGRDAGQFEKSIDRAVNTIYKLADDAYQLEESKIQDPTALLFARLSQQQKHSPIARKFERSICNGWKIYMALAKHYFDDDMVIKAVGKDLPKNVVARIINEMPYLSKNSVASDMLLTDKNITNDILALDRGEWVEAAKDDDHDQYIPRLKSRMKQADFRLLPDQIKQMYQARYQQHVDFKSQLEAELKQAEMGYFPMDGGLVKVSIWDQATGKNLLMPAAAILKLKDILEKQGADQQTLQQMDASTQAEILTKASQLAQSNQPPQPQPQAAPGPIPA